MERPPDTGRFNGSVVHPDAMSPTFSFVLLKENVPDTVQKKTAFFYSCRHGLLPVFCQSSAGCAGAFL